VASSDRPRATRRAALACIVTAATRGCLGTPVQTTAETTDATAVREPARQRLVACERHHIRAKKIGDDERIDGPLEPTVVELDERDDGVYAVVRTTFGTVQSSADAPDLRVDYEVTAHYYRGRNGTFRTEAADRDPANGVRVQCE
jgi:hypothetical protein